MSAKIDEKIQIVYDFIVDFIGYNGYPPSVREICLKCNIKSTATAYLYLERLKSKGLLDKSSNKKRAISTTNNFQFKKVPLIGVIRAGLPIFAVENLEGYYPLPPDFNANDNEFALRVTGNSMINAGIFDKDIIIVEKQEWAKNGDIVVALVDDCATVKRFYIKDGKIILHPENDSMEDMIYENVSVVGIVKGLFRKF